LISLLLLAAALSVGVMGSGRSCSGWFGYTPLTRVKLTGCPPRPVRGGGTLTITCKPGYHHPRDDRINCVPDSK
jgi:hypothetical protein